MNFFRIATNTIQIFEFDQITLELPFKVTHWLFFWLFKIRVFYTFINFCIDFLNVNVRGSIYCTEGEKGHFGITLHINCLNCIRGNIVLFTIYKFHFLTIATVRYSFPPVHIEEAPLQQIILFHSCHNSGCKLKGHISVSDTGQHTGHLSSPTLVMLSNSQLCLSSWWIQEICKLSDPRTTWAQFLSQLWEYFLWKRRFWCHNHCSLMISSSQAEEFCYLTNRCELWIQQRTFDNLRRLRDRHFPWYEEVFCSSLVSFSQRSNNEWTHSDWPLQFPANKKDFQSNIQ